MRFTVQYPIAHSDADPGMVGPEGMIRLATLIEQAGYDAVAFTEHPAPSSAWLQSGGHQSLDIPAALGFCAAVTRRIRLMSYLLVLPYHQPFIAAKAVSTVDRLSRGRVTLVVGTGYLASEFEALDVDIERRNELFDEALGTMRRAWSGLPVAVPSAQEGGDVVSLPGPVQPGGPPVWIGGNSVASRRRAARNQGWSPLLLGADRSWRTRTAALEGMEQLAERIAETRRWARELQGPDATVTVQLQTPESWLSRHGSPQEHRAHLHALQDAGVDWFVVKPGGSSVDDAARSLEIYADRFIRGEGHGSNDNIS